MASPIGISAAGSPRFNSLSPPPLCLLHSVSSSHPFHSHLFSHHPEAAKFSFNLSLKNKSLSRASSAEQAGIPNELAEDSKFVPLNADDPVFGPPVSWCLVLLSMSGSKRNDFHLLLLSLV
ncbi:hypothetical protein LINPERPRIM_LOCUS23880 [Linum perenne]